MITLRPKMAAKTNVLGWPRVTPVAIYWIVRKQTYYKYNTR